MTPGNKKSAGFDKSGKCKRSGGTDEEEEEEEEEEGGGDDAAATAAVSEAPPASPPTPNLDVPKTPPPQQGTHREPRADCQFAKLKREFDDDINDDDHDTTRTAKLAAQVPKQPPRYRQLTLTGLTTETKQGPSNFKTKTKTKTNTIRQDDIMIEPPPFVTALLVEPITSPARAHLDVVLRGPVRLLLLLLVVSR